MAAFRLTANVALSARQARVHRSAVYQWQEHDPAFALAFQQAEQESTDLLEAEAFRRAYEGVYSEKPIVRDGVVVASTTEIAYSDQLMTFLLKARRPEKYRERQAIEHSGPGGGPIETRDGLSDAERATRLAALLDIVRRRTEAAG